MPIRAVPLLAATLAGLAALPLPAQEHDHHAPERTWGIGAQVIGLATHATPAVFGESRTEGYLTQPNVMGYATLAGGAVTFQGTLNFEGLTLQRGELNAGIWGEGYVDRRHPHTFLHELVGTVRHGALSLSAGKGFVPFGTDDPMARPLVKFPVNHHLAQILERAFVLGALRAGPVVVEGALFNGDEPMGTTDLPNLERFGDSWAARLTLLPLEGVELQGSHAWVTSPELETGGGMDQRKWSASARTERELLGARGYALVEWARTQDVYRGRPGTRYFSLLAEAALERGATRASMRLERTTRPEEERLENPFRSPRPHGDFHILGVTRWEIVSASLGREVGSIGALALAPFIEGSYARATERLRPSAFQPELFYGSDRMWSLSAGIRLSAGGVHARMGRYGVALPGSRH